MLNHFTDAHGEKVESTNSRLHGICLVERLPKDTDDLGKRVPSF